MGECFGVLVSIAPARWQPAATRHYVAPRPVMQFSAGPLDALLSPLPFFSLPHLRFAEWNPVGIFGVFSFFLLLIPFFFFSLVDNKKENEANKNNKFLEK